MGETEVQRFKVYFLRLFSLWDGDQLCVGIGKDLEAIVSKIVNEKSIKGFVDHEVKPIKYCQIEEEEAIFLPAANKVYYCMDRIPVWKMMVPKANVYSRETIIGCIARDSGRNLEKYKNVLYSYPKSTEFFTFSSSEIRPVDDTVFIIDK